MKELDVFWILIRGFCQYCDHFLLLGAKIELSQAKHLQGAGVTLAPGPGGGGVFLYMCYMGMCGPKGYGFSAVLVINRVSILAGFGHFGHK